MRSRLLVVALLLFLTSSWALAEAPAAFEEGMKALLKGNFAEAYCHWRPLAERGHAESQYHLGWLYANGNGMNVDVQQALRWWQAAAEQGHADAAFALGLDYMTGEGGERDMAKAAHWLYRAAAAGHADAREVLLRLAGDTATGDLLEMVPALAEAPWFGWLAEVRGDRVNVRAGPGKSHRIVGKLKRGQRVRVVGRRDNWLRIRLPAGQETAQSPFAWVYHSLLRPVSKEAV
ncbi:MAG: hypothetical protein D6720_05350 [Gammaproteobacteria bacterium]|nr:MAG: hypothetical protein D6720_05350 [Gammaproteobacteria bacterium]